MSFSLIPISKIPLFLTEVALTPGVFSIFDILRPSFFPSILTLYLNVGYPLGLHRSGPRHGHMAL